MKWWPRRHRRQASSERDAHYAADVAHMNRALTDAKHLGRAADELTHRADEINEGWQRTVRRNGIAEAAIESIRRQVRHS